AVVSGARDRGSSGVTAEVEAVPIAVLVQPSADVVVVEGAAQADELVVDERVHRVQNDGAHGSIAACLPVALGAEWIVAAGPPVGRYCALSCPGTGLTQQRGEDGHEEGFGLTRPC